MENFIFCAACQKSYEKATLFIKDFEISYEVVLRDKYF